MSRLRGRRWPKLTPLTCPFCGSKPRLFPVDPESEGNAWGSVSCVAKRCSVKPVAMDGSNIADDRGTGAYQDMAIRKWNKRASGEK